MELDELEALAKVATRGPWEVWTSNSHIRITAANGPDGGVVSAIVAPDGVPVLAIRQDDAAFIAAMSPEVVLSLIAAARELEERRWVPK